MTNFEKIKSMDIDEMGNFLCGLCADTIMTSLGGPPTKSPNKKWLKSEVDDCEIYKIFCSPDICPNCQYIGEGDSICDVTMAIVLDGWVPTEDFMENCPSMKD